LDFTIEEKTWEAMREHAPLIKTVSAERIAEEIGKLMTAEKPSRGFTLMRDCGLLAHVLPELDALRDIGQDKQPGEDVFDHTMRVLDAARADSAIKHAGNIDLLFAALLHDIGKSKTRRYHEPSERVVFFGHQIASKRMARRWMERTKITMLGVNPDTVCTLIEHHMFETKAYFTDKAIRRFIAKVSPELIFLLMDLRLADNRGGKHPTGIKGVQKLAKRIKAEMDRKPPFGPKDLAVGGHELMELGIPEGPQIGKTLAGLVQLVLDNPELNTKEQLLALAKNMRENPDPS
jgi:poly(A) polymerase/tRNA nucleotidyltransferase (CCA-adding enzyme)